MKRTIIIFISLLAPWTLFNGGWSMAWAQDFILPMGYQEPWVGKLLFNSEGGYVIILDSIEVRGLTAPYLTLVGPIAAENGTVATFTAIAPNASNFEWAINGTPVDATGNVLTNTFASNHQLRCSR